MIFLDANVFLRFFVTPGTPQDVVTSAQARELFERVKSGEAIVTTSEAIIAEVAFILAAPHHYARTRADAVGLLKTVLHLDDCRIPEKEVVLRALDTWETQPRLSFPDALAAAYSELIGHELATFDARLLRLPDVTPFSFPSSKSQDHSGPE